MAHGANGFMREFQGSFGGTGRFAQVSLAEKPHKRGVRVVLKNSGSTPLQFKLTDATYGERTELTLTVPAGSSVTQFKQFEHTGGWYDIVVRIVGDSAFKVRLAGHVEGAGLDFTDPVLNGLAQATWVVPPVIAAPPPPPPATFTADKTEVVVGDGPVVSWSGLAASPTNWIGVYLEGQTPGVQGSLKWNYIATASGSQQMLGLPVGSYFIGLFLNDGYTEAAPRLPLKVLPSAARRRTPR